MVTGREGDVLSLEARPSVKIFPVQPPLFNPQEVGVLGALFLGGETDKLQGIQLYQQLGCRPLPMSGIM